MFVPISEIEIDPELSGPSIEMRCFKLGNAENTCRSKSTVRQADLFICGLRKALRVAGGVSSLLRQGGGDTISPRLHVLPQVSLSLSSLRSPSRLTHVLR